MAMKVDKRYTRKNARQDNQLRCNGGEGRAKGDLLLDSTFRIKKDTIMKATLRRGGRQKRRRSLKVQQLPKSSGSGHGRPCRLTGYVIDGGIAHRVFSWVRFSA